MKYAATNWIYIVFAVLYIIYSIVKAVKKNAEDKAASPKTTPGQQPASQNIPDNKPAREVRPPVERGKDLQEMLEEVLGKIPEMPARPEEKKPIPTKPEPVQIRPQPARIITHAKREKAAVSHVPSKTKRQATPFLTGKTEAGKKSSAPQLVSEDEGETAEADFDIRQAILYSEILKRPNW